MGALELPALTCFIRQSGSLSPDELDAFARAHWPKLERLEVWLGGPASTVTSVDQLRPLLLAARGWPLRVFGLLNHELGPALLPELAGLDWVRRLERLSLAKCTFIDDDLEALIDLAGQLTGQLDLSENLLSSEAVAELKRRAPNAMVELQRFDDQQHWGPDRFVAVGE